MNTPKLTPMMQQYLAIKAGYPDAILFYRMGDFYEMFGPDALEAAPILGIALTTRDKGKEDAVPMCGVPFHSAQGYIARLIKAGRKVAVCEQGEMNGKGLVPREVVQVITPGLIAEDAQLEGRKPNYLMAVCKNERQAVYGLAFIDITTGDFRVTELKGINDFHAEIDRVAPSEIITPAEGLAPEGFFVTLCGAPEQLKAQEILSGHFKTVGVRGLGLTDQSPATIAAAMALVYVKDKQKAALSGITRLRFYNPGRFMLLGMHTSRNLELFETLGGAKEGSLFSLIDQTVTTMGGRRLADWLSFPLMDIEAINARLDAVAELKENAGPLSEIRTGLKGVYDLERILGRIIAERAGPRDLVALGQGLEQVPPLRALCRTLRAQMLKGLHLDPLEAVSERISATLVPDPPLKISEGGFILDGVDAELDEFRSIRKDSRAFMARLEASERRATGISTLRISYNRVFGYYIEVTKAHAAKVPEHYIRKQTLVGAERFITPELKEYEAKLLGAQEAIAAIEARLFKALRDDIVKAAESIKATVEDLIVLDVLAALAWLALQNDYARPLVDGGRGIEIKGGRHPVVEKVLKPGQFVPNDCRFEPDTDSVHIITGPNMAGKSTYMRQIALVLILAQMGSFVPAAQARIGVADRIFTRIGALDNLSAGQSTFMMEMSETADILHNATASSVIVLDEIGRGTSTYDGMSLAWAVAECLDERRARTFFATHYHELADLARRRKGVKNFHMAVDDSDREVVFLREVRRGAIGKSYGIHVAKLAGIPEEVIHTARQVLASVDRKARTVGTKTEAPLQTSLFEDDAPTTEHPVIRTLSELDLTRMTPLEALNLLSELKEKIKKNP
ncbi:MAG: DNA mismatch repair protein MutS [Syntrophaceae bacterium]